MNKCLLLILSDDESTIIKISIIKFKVFQYKKLTKILYWKKKLIIIK